MRDYKKQLQELAKLQDDWDTYGARRPSAKALARAEELLSILVKLGRARWHIVPTVEGGVQIEQHRDGLEVEILISPAGGEQ